LNYNYQQVRRYHDNYQIKNKVNLDKKYTAYLFEVKKTGKIEVYLPEINLFLKGYLFPEKLAFQYQLEKVDDFYVFESLMSENSNYIVPEKMEISIIETKNLLYTQRYQIKI
jgi:hypothetical protein